MEITAYDWSQVQKEQMNPKLARQVIHGEKMTVARVFMKKGGAVPEHNHASEEMALLEQGMVQYFIDGKERRAIPGQVVEVPSNSTHKLVALEDTVVLFVFAPVREDWKRGEDAYLRG